MLAEVLNFQGAKPILGMGSLSKYDYSIFYVPAGITSLAELDEVTVGEEKIHIIPEIDGKDLKLCHGNCIFFVHGKNLMKLTHEVFERCTK